MKAALKEISVLLFKLEGQVILRNPDYKMEDKLLLHKVDVARQTVEIDGRNMTLKKRLSRQSILRQKIWRMYTNSPKRKSR